MNLVDIEIFRSDARLARPNGGRPSDVGVMRLATSDPAAVAGKARTLRFCFSDGSVDRAGDTIDPNGWDLTGFQRNPVALWAHNSWEPPIGRASALAVEGAKLMGDIEFAAPETYEFADTIYRLAVGKFINAVSVGFLPLEWSYVEDKERGFGIDFKRQELLEISVVPVPCNANALGEARAKGIDTRPLVAWAEKVIEGGGNITIPRSELERLRKAAKEPSMTKSTPRRRGDGLGEDDPAAGGAVVRGNCGHAKDEECGMSNSEECEVHGSGDKTLTVAELRAVVRAELKRLAPRVRDAADGDPDAAGGEDHEECVRAAHAHVKAAGALYEAADDHHDKAMKCLQKAVDHMDDPEAEKAEGADAGDADEQVRAAHAHLKAAEDLSDQASEHHDKAADFLAKAIDDFADPEAEGDGDKARAAARRRAQAARRAHERDAAA